MHKLIPMTAALLALPLFAAPADAQVRHGGHHGGRTIIYNGGGYGGGFGGGRWGGFIAGQWYAGNYAPGGWNGYRRPHRGWHLPRYWRSSHFYINDFARYRLAPPPFGYVWIRYYNDAVLVDGRGRVRDYVENLPWAQFDQGYAATSYRYQQGAPAGGCAPQGCAPAGAGYAQGGGWHDAGASYGTSAPVADCGCAGGATSGYSTGYTTQGYTSGGMVVGATTAPTAVTVTTGGSTVTTTTVVEDYEYVDDSASHVTKLSRRDRPTKLVRRDYPSKLVRRQTKRIYHTK